MSHADIFTAAVTLTVDEFAQVRAAELAADAHAHPWTRPTKARQPVAPIQPTVPTNLSRWLMPLATVNGTARFVS